MIIAKISQKIKDIKNQKIQDILNRQQYFEEKVREIVSFFLICNFILMLFILVFTDLTGKFIKFFDENLDDSIRGAKVKNLAILTGIMIYLLYFVINTIFIIIDLILYLNPLLLLIYNRTSVSSILLDIIAMNIVLFVLGLLFIYIDFMK